MARDYCNIFTAIWRDRDFIALSSNAQRVYLMLVTQSEISSCGALAMTIKRWAGYASDSTVDSLSDGLSELERQAFVVIDNDVEELLVRSFVRHDRGYNNSRRLPAIIAAAHSITSPLLRQVMAHELNRLSVVHDLPDSPYDALSHSPSDTPPDSPRVVVTVRTTDPQPTTHNPQPTTPEQSGIAPAAPKRAATRQVPEDFHPSAKALEWQKANHPNVNAADETERFINHHRAKGSKFADLDAAWRNWIKNAVKFAAEQPRSLRSVAGTQGGKTPAWQIDERWA